MIYAASRCYRCRHLFPGSRKKDGKRTCKAFPEKIPIEILAGKVAHLKPYPGDNGIMFEPKEEEPER